MMKKIFNILLLSAFLIFIGATNAHADAWKDFVDGDDMGVHHANDAMFHDKIAPTDSFPPDSEVDISTTCFANCNFKNKYFNNENSTIADSEFNDCNCFGLKFKNAAIFETKFIDDTNLENADFSECLIDYCKFQNVKCHGDAFFGAGIFNCEFNNVGLVDSSFRKSVITNTIITPMEPSKNELKNSPNPYGADFYGAVLEGVKFKSDPKTHRVRLQNTNFGYARLSSVDFSSPDETRREWGADLTGADFSNAKFESNNIFKDATNFTGAKIDGARFKGAKITSGKIIWVDGKEYGHGEEPWGKL